MPGPSLIRPWQREMHTPMILQTHSSSSTPAAGKCTVRRLQVHPPCRLQTFRIWVFSCCDTRAKGRYCNQLLLCPSNHDYSYCWRRSTASSSRLQHSAAMPTSVTLRSSPYETSGTGTERSPPSLRRWRTRPPPSRSSSLRAPRMTSSIRNRNNSSSSSKAAWQW